MSQSHARMRKLPVHDHMRHVFKIDILIGHEEVDYLHFILKIIFHCISIKNMNFLKLVQLIMKVKHIVQRSFDKCLFPKP